MLLKITRQQRNITRRDQRQSDSPSDCRAAEMLLAPFSLDFHICAQIRHLIQSTSHPATSTSPAASEMTSVDAVPKILKYLPHRLRLIRGKLNLLAGFKLPCLQRSFHGDSAAVLVPPSSTATRIRNPRSADCSRLVRRVEKRVRLQLFRSRTAPRPSASCAPAQIGHLHFRFNFRTHRMLSFHHQAHQLLRHINLFHDRFPRDPRLHRSPRPSHAARIDILFARIRRPRSFPAASHSPAPAIPSSIPQASPRHISARDAAPDCGHAPAGSRFPPPDAARTAPASA